MLDARPATAATIPCPFSLSNPAKLLPPTIKHLQENMSMRLTSLLIASLFLAITPSFADGFKKTDLPAGEYEYLGTTDNSKTTTFVVLSDGTATIKAKSWVQKTDRFPLSALKPGLYKRLHFKGHNNKPEDNNPDADRFEILADGTLKLDSSIEDGPSPFLPNTQISATNVPQ